MSLFAHISGFMLINGFLLSRVRSEFGQQPADPVPSLVPRPGHWTGNPGDWLRCSYCCCFTTTRCFPSVSLPFSCVVIRFRVSSAAGDCCCSLLISTGIRTEPLPVLMCQLPVLAPHETPNLRLRQPKQVTKNPFQLFHLLCQYVFFPISN